MTMTPDPNRVAAIAESLTKAQRASLIGILHQRPNGDQLISGARATQKALEIRGLSGRWGSITPLGLAVRDHLLAGGE